MSVRPAGAARRGAAGSEEVLARRAALWLGAQAAAFVATVAIVLTGVAVLVLLDAQDQAATSLLNGAIARADDVQDPPAGVYLVIRWPSGLQQATAGLPDGVADLAALGAARSSSPQLVAERRVGGVEYRLATVHRADDVTVQGILDLTENHAQRDRLVTTMLATGAAGLLLAAVAGTWLGLRTVHPLSAALALQRRFVADAGHELRTPLALLGTRAQILRRRLRRRDGDGTGAAPPGPLASATGGAPGAAGASPARRDQVVADVEGIVADSARLTEILEDLLLAADPLARRPRRPVELAELCQEAVAAAGPAAADRGIDVQVRGHGPVEILGSAPALHRALTALIDNAIRHATRSVTVSLATVGGSAVVDVSDDGAGVDPTLAPRLFERFATGPTGPGGPRRRYGLGLALVAEIVAAHRGHVELLGHRAGGGDIDQAGSTFRITLPTTGDARRVRRGPRRRTPPR